MMFEIPTTLTHYTPVMNWLFRMFEGHNDVYTESQLHYKIRYLIKLYAAGENTQKLAHDLSEMECWQTRTLALSDYKVPEYWDPLYETFQHYKTRMLAENRLIKSFDLLGANPPRDIIYSHICAVLKIGHHAYLDNTDQSFISKDRYQKNFHEKTFLSQNEADFDTLNQDDQSEANDAV